MILLLSFFSCVGLWGRSICGKQKLHYPQSCQYYTLICEVVPRSRRTQPWIKTGTKITSGATFIMNITVNKLNWPSCNESICGLWEKEVPFHVCSTSFSLTWVIVSQSRTLAGTIWLVAPVQVAAAGITTFRVYVKENNGWSGTCLWNLFVNICLHKAWKSTYMQSRRIRTFSR